MAAHWFEDNRRDSADQDLPASIRGRRFILFVGELTPPKNLERLIMAYSLLKVEEFSEVPHLVLVGPTSHAISQRYQERLARCIEEQDLQNRVHYLGPVSQATLMALMRRAEALAFVSLHEGFGLPIMEAMACGMFRCSLPKFHRCQKLQEMPQFLSIHKTCRT